MTIELHTILIFLFEVGIVYFSEYLSWKLTKVVNMSI